MIPRATAKSNQGRVFADTELRLLTIIYRVLITDERDAACRSAVQRFIYVVSLSVLCVACSPEVILDPDDLLERARQLTSERKPLSAINAAKKALQSDPDMLEARWLLAQNYLLVREGGLAIRQLDRLSDRNYEHPDLDAAVLRSLLLRGQFDEVIRRAAKFDISATELAVRGEAHLGRYNVPPRSQSKQNRDVYLAIAEQDFKRALVKKGDLLDAHFGLVRIAFRQSRYKRAGQLLNQAAEVDEQNPELWNLRGMRDQLVENYEAAEGNYRRAFEFAPYDPLVQINFARVLLAREKPEAAGDLLESSIRAHPANPVIHHLRAIGYLQEGDERAATIALRSTVKHFPSYVPAQQLLGRISRSAGQSDQTEIAVRAALDVSALDEKGLARIKEIYTRSPAKNRALSVGAQTIANTFARDYRSDGDGRRAELNRAEGRQLQQERFLAKSRAEKEAIFEALFASEDYELVSDLAFAASQSDPDDPIPYHWMAISALERGNRGNARTLFTLTLKRDPEFMPSISKLAELEFLAGNYDSARELFERAVKLDGDDEQSRLGLARLDILAEDWASAKSRIARISEARPNSIEVLFVQAELADRRGLTSKRLEILNQILALDINSIDARMRIAQTLFNERRYQETGNLLNEVTLIDPYHLKALLLLSEVQYQSGDFDNSYDTVVRARDLYPDDPEVRSAMKTAERRRQNRSSATSRQSE